VNVANATHALAKCAIVVNAAPAIHATAILAPVANAVVGAAVNSTMSTNFDTTIVGKQIASGRKLKGLSQAQFAVLLNISAQAVGKWERSESLPDIFTLGKIGEIIGTTDINYFLGKAPCDCTCGSCGCCKK